MLNQLKFINMPFVSEAQRRFMYLKHPEIAKRWEDKYGTPKNLPYHKAVMSELKKRVKK